MRRRSLAILALIAALGLLAPAAMADHDGDRDHGNPHRHFRDDDHGRHGDRDDDRDGDRWERRGRYEYHSFDRDARPPGWVRGRKVGWGYCGLPPGQARKYGCWSYVHEGRRYYYYRDDDDRIIVRRPIIRIQAGVDIVQ
ncbi:MAG TPA: hypothetical protein VKT29_00805 [Terriglobales bacterium]|nr:hypothetical protein [Terriglobales bacterium]